MRLRRYSAFNGELPVSKEKWQEGGEGPLGVKRVQGFAMANSKVRRFCRLSSAPDKSPRVREVHGVQDDQFFSGLIDVLPAFACLQGPFRSGRCESTFRYSHQNNNEPKEFKSRYTSTVAILTASPRNRPFRLFLNCFNPCSQL